MEAAQPTQMVAISHLTICMTSYMASPADTLPPGSSFDSVYTYLKSRQANHVVLGRRSLTTVAKAQPSSPSTLTADYERRFLLSNFRFHTKFVFDRHERLTHCWIRLLI